MITITDNGANLEITMLDGSLVEMIKPVDVEILSGYLSLRDIGGKNERLKYSDISLPTSTDIVNLKDKLMAFNNVGTGVIPNPLPVKTSVAEPTVTLVITKATLTGSGSTTAGAKKVKLMTSDDFTGTIEGVSEIPYFEKEYYVAGYHVPAIPYVVATGNIQVTYFN